MNEKEYKDFWSTQASADRSYNENPKQRRNAMRHLIDMHLNDLLFWVLWYENIPIPNQSFVHFLKVLA